MNELIRGIKSGLLNNFLNPHLSQLTLHGPIPLNTGTLLKKKIKVRISTEVYLEPKKVAQVTYFPHCPISGFKVRYSVAWNFFLQETFISAFSSVML